MASAAHQHDQTPGYVYFAQAEDTGFVKIGWTRDPAQRVRQLRSQAASDITPLGAKPGIRLDERAAHAQWAHCRLFGEWFQPSSDLLHFAASFGTDVFKPRVTRAPAVKRPEPAHGPCVAELTAPEYAGRYGFCVETIRSWIRDGWTLPMGARARRVSGRRYKHVIGVTRAWLDMYGARESDGMIAAPTVGEAPAIGGET